MADFTITQISSNTTGGSDPQINNNGDVVYVGSDGDDEIYLYKKGTTTKLTNNTIKDYLPRINDLGSVVYLSGTYSPKYDRVNLYKNGTTTQLPGYGNTDAWAFSRPEINNNDNVVWRGFNTDYGDYTIFLYKNGVKTDLISLNPFNVDYSYRAQINDFGDIVYTAQDYDTTKFGAYFYKNGSTTLLANNLWSASTVQINNNDDVVWNNSTGLYLWKNGTTTRLSNGDNQAQINNHGDVVYRDIDNNGRLQIYLYKNGTTTQVSNNNTNKTLNQPQINENGDVTWWDFSGYSYDSTSEVYLYKNGTTTQLTNNNTVDGWAQISNNGDVVWQQQTGNNIWQVYLAQTISNSNPIAINLSNNTIAENQPANSLIGILTTVDPDAGQTFTYSLVTGIGSEDNSAFTISGNQLLAKTFFDFETKNTLSLRVKTEDNQGGSLEKNLIINVSDINESLAISNLSLQEGNTGTTTANFVVTLSNPSMSAITVAYNTLNGSATAASDYSATSGILTFNPNETSKTIAVSVVGDNLVEKDETFSLNLTNPTGATLSQATATGTILNDDSASLAINNVTISEGNSQTQKATFTVTLSNPSDEAITVAYNTLNGSATAASDYSGTSGILTFNPNETSKTIAVSVVGDNLVEKDETFSLNLTNPTGATLSQATATGTILNDDSASLAINNVTISEGNSQTQKATFTVTLSNPSDEAITVAYNTLNGSATAATDYSATSGILTFNPNETSKTIDVSVNSDNLVERNETLFVSLSNPSNNTTIGSNTGKATIIDSSDPTKNNGFNTIILDSDNNNYTAVDKTYDGINPQNWKNDGAKQISADVGGDNKSYIDYTGTTGNTAGNSNDGNAEIFTALDGDGSDLNNTTNLQFKTWVNQLIAAGKLTGIGVGSESNSTSNQALSNNPEIQSGVGIGTEDRLLIDFGTLAKTASVQLSLFFGQEIVNWRWLSQNYQNPSLNSDLLLNQFSRAAEQAKYQLLRADVNGSIDVNSQKYTLVQDWQTLTSPNGSFAIGSDANTGNIGIQDFNITSSQPFDTIRFAGQDYNPPTPTITGFKPNDVSDYLLNKVALVDQVIYGGDGNDTIAAGAGDDTIFGEEGSDRLLGGTGADLFGFDSLAGVDTIADFNPTQADVIQISKSGFLSQYNLPITTSSAEVLNNLSYNSGTKTLSFDPDGAGPNLPINFAIIQGNFSLANNLAIVE